MRSFPERAKRSMSPFPVVINDPAIGGFVGTNHGLNGGGFATAAFPGKAQGFAPVDIKIHPVDSFDIADNRAEETALDGEIFFQVADFQDEVGHRGSEFQVRCATLAYPIRNDLMFYLDIVRL